MVCSAVGLKPTMAPSERLLEILSDGKCHLMPCCYDGMSARLISKHPANFDVTFMTGFGVAASLGYPDAGILSSSDNLNQARSIVESLQQSR